MVRRGEKVLEGGKVREGEREKAGEGGGRLAKPVEAHGRQRKLLSRSKGSSRVLEVKVAVLEADAAVDLRCKREGWRR